MVKGLERFREYFAGHESSYALIGGVACHILFSMKVAAQTLKRYYRLEESARKPLTATPKGAGR